MVLKGSPAFSGVDDSVAMTVFSIPGMPQSWNERRTVTTGELTMRYGIPREELESFQTMLRIYPNNWTIIEEGAPGKSLFLVRVGRVGVYRKIAGQAEKIAEIEAVNFFGEMSLINDAPRNATVKADSEVVIVYEIASPNMSLILRNAKWAELLITRLCRNLAETNAQNVAALQTMKTLREEVQTLQSQVEEHKRQNLLMLQQAERAFSAILKFQNLIRDLAVVGSRGWAYLKAMGDVTRYLAAHYLPAAHIAEDQADPKVMKSCLDAMKHHHPPSILDEISRLR